MPRLGARFSLSWEGVGRHCTLRIEGVVRFLLCEPTEMRLQLSRGMLSVCGRELCYLVYGGGALEITGQVLTVQLMQEDER